MKKFFGVILVLLLAVSFLAACGPGTPAEFTLSSVTVSPSAPVVNDTVTIGTTVTNAGEVSDGCVVSLTIDGYTDSQSISSLAGGASTPVSFSYAATTEGNYTATVSTPNATKSKNFTVSAAGVPLPYEEALPVWHVDDSWVYDCSYENPEGTLKQGDVELNATVTGEESVGGEDCYKLRAVFTPSAARDSTTAGMTMSLHVGQADVWNSKAFMLYMKQSSSIKEPPGLPASVTWAYTPAPSWPLEGTWDLTKRTVAAIVDETVNRQGKVLGMESVTVPAGTFSCYYVVEYDPASPDTYTYEHWFNTTVKSDVKMIDRDTWDGAETRVLVSYSVS